MSPYSAQYKQGLPVLKSKAARCSTISKEELKRRFLGHLLLGILFHEDADAIPFMKTVKSSFILTTVVETAVFLGTLCV